MDRIPLVLRLVIAIFLGFILGSILGPLSREGYVTANVPIQLLTTFNGLFSNFLGFIVPLLILSFVAVGIGELGQGAGKMLGITIFLAYTSTTLAAFLALMVGTGVLPNFLNNGTVDLNTIQNLNEFLPSAYFDIAMPGVFSAMTALILAFVLGVGLASSDQDSALFSSVKTFQNIIEKVITNIIIPLLPFHIAGIFASMAFGGKAIEIMRMMAIVFALIIVMHWTILIVHYIVAGLVKKVNPFTLLKNMIPAYVAAIGTQSSTATMPVTHRQMIKNGLSEDVANFTVPLFATIHMPGSVITVTTCAIAVSTIMGHSLDMTQLIGFILMLGVMMVAAPGVPGGSIMASIGILESMLGFDPIMISLMVTLYLAQDSFGTATNVTSDGALAFMVEKVVKKQKAS
ncbi:dicarboxylate/amino acid:cation symporter [Entomospira nematocerorum]|uniref:Dicarboxylate/amino acid:cation symporter n=1 Tax=Entomospira nematocerorum TaxID=2719987 RepID=A0A968GCU4_9SPIO|nr:dicarboxylate/amino acid:cation symporter [Entomospira nematocera]NIZ47093.1 dicarboxylate/amino acid:cation symporter [Entomospira nematocera]WDI34362.1 dicarboxylate/amino acid:cation symporter [Entomospira nematocera]